MGSGDEFSLEVLKNALKTQRLEARQREDALKEQLTKLSLRAKKEREMLLKEISALKGSVSSPKSAKASSPHSSSNPDHSSSSSQPSGFDLWNLDAEGKAAGPPEDAGAKAKGEWDGSADWELGGGGRYRVMSLEAKLQAQNLEIQELRTQLAQQETSLTKQQQRNGSITAKLEDRDLHIQSLEGKISRLQRRLNSLNAFAPPEWAPRITREGSGLSGAGERDNASLLQGASGHNNWHQEDGFGGEELVPGFDEFVSKLRGEESAGPLRGMIESFVSAFLLKSPKMSDNKMVHNFLGAMESPIRSHPLWKGVGDEDFPLVIDALEAYILGDERVYECIFSSMGDDWLSMDRHLNRRLWCLQFVQPAHLDIKRSHYTHPAMTLARKSMKRMTEVRPPQAKIECVFRAARVIFRMLNEAAAASRSEAASADDFLPIFIYTVLKAHTWRLHSTLEYISLFRNPNNFGGEREYYLVQLQTALGFIAHMDGKSLSMDEAEFDRRLKEREEQWDAKYGKDGGGADGSLSEGLGFSSEGPNDSGSDLTSQL